MRSWSSPIRSTTSRDGGETGAPAGGDVAGPEDRGDCDGTGDALGSCAPEVGEAASSGAAARAVGAAASSGVRDSKPCASEIRACVLCQCLILQEFFKGLLLYWQPLAYLVLL